jgi:hypothetical protein
VPEGYQFDEQSVRRIEDVVLKVERGQVPPLGPADPLPWGNNLKRLRITGASQTDSGTKYYPAVVRQFTPGSGWSDVTNTSVWLFHPDNAALSGSYWGTQFTHGLGSENLESRPVFAVISRDCCETSTTCLSCVSVSAPANLRVRIPEIAGTWTGCSSGNFHAQVQNFPDIDVTIARVGDTFSYFGERDLAPSPVYRISTFGCCTFYVGTHLTVSVDCTGDRISVGAEVSLDAFGDFGNGCPTEQGHQPKAHYLLEILAGDDFSISCGPPFSLTAANRDCVWTMTAKCISTSTNPPTTVTFADRWPNFSGFPHANVQLDAA